MIIMKFGMNQETKGINFMNSSIYQEISTALKNASSNAWKKVSQVVSALGWGWGWVSNVTALK